MKRKLFAAAMICAALMAGCEKPQPEEPDKKPDTPLEPEKPDKPDQPEKPDEPTWQMTDVASAALSSLSGSAAYVNRFHFFSFSKSRFKPYRSISISWIPSRPN